MADLNRKPASAHTDAANAAIGAALPVDATDHDLAARGRIAPLPGPVIHPAFGHAVWDLAEFAFLESEAPPTANPSLWRQARLNAVAGLFEVVPGVYQVRGIDLSNVTFIEGDTGWIVIDPLSAAETAAAALDLLHAHRPERPIVAVIYTHSHIDHFGGVRGIVDEADVASGRIRIIAPEGFLHAAISENVIAGNVMARRASYMYGRLLPAAPDAHIDCGLGKGIPLIGTAGLIAPTEEVAATGAVLDVDGVTIEFQVTPDTEAPAEMNFLFPDKRLLCMAENCTATLHNVYTPRGAQIRDALSWSKYIDEAIELYGDRADVVFASHHWPRWGNEVMREYLAVQRDTYRFVHDQTMRLANHGRTAIEIAEDLALPASLADEFHVRGYYGTLNHNAKAVYQRYLGWFDANPANLHPLPPEDAAGRYVEFMGGADAVLTKARASFAAGDYRWVAQVVNHLVFADPANTDARALQADALEQLGYQAESGPWRDFYLTGAQELRHGTPRLPGNLASNPDIVAAMTTEMLLDLIAVRLDGPAVAATPTTPTTSTASTATTSTSGTGATDGPTPIAFDLVVRPDERWFVEVSHGALHTVSGRHGDTGVVLTLDHADLVRLATGTATLDALIADERAVIDGDRAPVDHLLAHLDEFTMGFAIVEP